MIAFKFALCLALALYLTFSSPLVVAQQRAAAVAYPYKILSGDHRVSGQQNALVILVDFLDVHHTKSAQDIQTIALTDLNAYYSEVSYGHITITGAVYGWYTVNHTMGYYGHDDTNPGDDNNVFALAQDALASLPSSVNVTVFQELLIVHAGQDQATDQYNVQSDEIWSSCYCSVFPNYEAPTPVSYRGKTFANYLFVSEFNGVGTYAHELGHMFGLPDLYDTTTENSYVGFWSLMDSGNYCCYNDAEATPSYIGGWGATLLGWLSPTIGDSNAPITFLSLNPLESRQASAMIIPISKTTYYFVEERIQSRMDSHLPTSGILVYLVDESLDTGDGILKLVDPKTGNPSPEQSDPRALEYVTFRPSDHLFDSTNSIYLDFIGGGGSTVTALYTTQPITGTPMSTQLHASQTQITVPYSEQISSTIVLVDQTGNPMGGQQIQVDVQSPTGRWQEVASATTSQEGGALIELSLKYNVGAYNLRLSYPGGKTGGVWYLPSTLLISANIVPAQLIATISQTPFTIIASPTIVTVTDSHGNPLSNAVVTAYLNGVPLPTVRTGSTGTASFTIQPNQLGNQAISANVTLTNYASETVTGSTFTIPIWLLLIIILVAGAASALIVLRLRRQKRSQP